MSYLDDEIEEVRSYISEPFFQTIDCSEGWHQLIVDFLLSKGADFNKKHLGGFTPLRSAVLHGHHGVMKSLLEARANPNEQHDVFKDTLLQTAVWQRDLAAVKSLAKMGANLDLGNVYGQTPLHDAAIRGYGEIYNYLVEKGANQIALNQDGMTPVSLAANKGYSGIVESF